MTEEQRDGVLKVQLKAGKRYSICSCGKSKVLPYCDGAHREWNEENNSDFKSIKISPDKDVEIVLQSVAWKG